MSVGRAFPTPFSLITGDCATCGNRVESIPGDKSACRHGAFCGRCTDAHTERCISGAADRDEAVELGRQLARERALHASTKELLAATQEERDQLRAERCDWVADVDAFHVLFGTHRQNGPGFPSEAVRSLRHDLNAEELSELIEGESKNDLVEVVDAIVDLIYVLVGHALTYGVDLRPIWREVHRANMAKVGGTRRDDGKILKPPGWIPPDVEGCLRAQGWR